MKLKLRLQTLAVILSIAASIGSATAQFTPKSSPGAIDPATGLPMLATPSWKDSNWPEPTNKLNEVNWDGLPVSEVANELRKRFNFDILMPSGNSSLNNAADISGIVVKLQLRNVSASEIFGAMNLEFEIENIPVHWELIMNGDRPTALLRIASEAARPKAEPVRTIFFVGDLLGTAQMPGMTMDQLVKTVTDVWQTAYGDPYGAILFHTQAQLLSVAGRADQIQYIEQTLSALKQKAMWDRSEKVLKPAEAGAKTEQKKF